MRISARPCVLATVVATGMALAAAAPATAGLRPAAHERAAAAAGTQLWVTHQGAAESGQSFQVAASPDGSAVFVAGQVNRPDKDPDAMLWAYSTTTGAPLWQAKHSQGLQSSFHAIAVSPDGSTVFVTGFLQPSGKPVLSFTAAYNAATGTLRWSATSAVSGSAAAIAVSPDGSSVFVTGAFGTVAYNAATGATRWTGPGAASTAVAPDGSAVYLASSRTGTGGHSNYRTIACNAVTGTQLWATPFNSPTNSEDTAIAATASAVVITGFRTATTGGANAPDNWLTLAYSPATGAQLWMRSYSNPKGGSEAWALAMSPDGSSVYVTGNTGTVPAGFFGDYATVAYRTATGATLWTARYHGPATGEGGLARAVAVTPDGTNVVVTGYNWSALPSSQPEFATVAYDAGTGTQLWVARLGRPRTQDYSARSVAVSPDSSKAFVTGSTGASGGATVAYSS